MASHAPKAVSLFTGAGGLDLGFEAAGFRTAVAVEMDPTCVATLEANRDWPIIDADIRSVPTSEILSTAKLETGEPDIVIGGPPCQPFSKSGYWARGDSRRLEDERADTLVELIRVLEETRPRAFLIENVAGLAYSGKSEGLLLLKEAIEGIQGDAGRPYSFAVAKLNAADFGVPQERQRVFIVGCRDGRTFRFPSPTHRPPEHHSPQGRFELALGLEPFHTAWDAIGDLDTDSLADESELQVGGKWADLLPSIPEGKNYLWHTERGGGRSLFGWRRRYWTFLLKLAKNRPSWTITAKPGSAIGPFHWRNRRLSRQELCRLQTFPDGFEVRGTLRQAQQQVGNAVPSALGERLALEIRGQLFDDDVETRRSTLLPLRRSPVPGPEPHQKVPPKYLDREGQHAPHPGTGRGYGAQLREATSDA